jgi:hypothetical protein
MGGGGGDSVGYKLSQQLLLYHKSRQKRNKNVGEINNPNVGILNKTL